MLETFPLLPNTTLIGLGHKARHGKDFAAQVIHEHFPTMTKIYRFADALKAVCRVEWGMTAKDGALLQKVGTDIYRENDPLVWVRSLYWQIAEEQPRFALIPDTRFPNEADFIHAVGGYLFKVTRLNQDGSLYVATDRDPNHKSEIALDGYDQWDKKIVAFSGSVDVLTEQALLAFDDVLEEVRP